MPKLATPITYEEFKNHVETLDQSRRAEYIAETMHRVLNGDPPAMLAYATEARTFWETKVCRMLEYSTISEVYKDALHGQLPKVEWRSKEKINRLARSLYNESKILDIVSASDEEAVTACFHAEALLTNIQAKRDLLAVYIHFPYAMRRRMDQTEFVNGLNDKALALARELGAQDEEMQILVNFGRQAQRQLDFEKALGFFKESLAILDSVLVRNSIEDSPRTLSEEFLLPKSLLHHYIANCTLNLGLLNETIYHCNQAIAYAVRLNDAMTNVYNQQLIAKAYTLLGAYHTALEHLLKAGSIVEAAGSPLLIGNNKLSIADIYGKLGEYQKAIEYGEQALALTKKHKPLEIYLKNSAEIGAFMGAAGEYDRAMELFTSLLASIESTESTVSLSREKTIILQNCARIAIHRLQWREAIDFLHLPLHFIDQNPHLHYVVFDVLLTAADAFIGAGNYPAATESAERNLELSKGIRNVDWQYKIHKQLSAIAELRGDFAKAFYHFKEFHALKEQVINHESEHRSHNMILMIEQQEAQRIAQEERLRRYELEEEIGKISTVLVHQEQALKEIRSTLRSMKSSPNESEQIVNVLQSLLRSTENATKAKATKTYKQLDDKIELAFPTLSRVQREVCRFIALGHTTKDIAGLMNISVQSVNTQRYRIRTRLGLDEQTTLDYVIKQCVK